MSNYAKLYWLTRLDTINGILGTVALLCIVISIIIAFIAFLEYQNYSFDSEDVKKENDNKKKSLFKRVKQLIITGVCCGIVFMFLPTKKDAIFIAAGGKTMDFIQSDTSINKIPGQTTAIVSEFLEKQLNDIKNETEITKEKK